LRLHPDRCCGACGGGGGDGAKIKELETRLEEAEKVIDEAEKAAEEAEDEVAEPEPAQPEETDDAAEARQEAVAQKKRADEAEAERDRLRQEAEKARRQLTEAQQAELSARASQYIAAINDGGTARSGVTVTYERGSTLKINPGGNFQAGAGAPAISGFTPRTYTRQVGGKQTLYLYTNIQAPGTRPFWKIHGLEVTDATATANEDRNPTPPRQPNTSLILATTHRRAVCE